MAALGALAIKNKSKILDGLVKLAPALKGPRKLVKDLLGFRARQFGPRKGVSKGNGRRKRLAKRAGGALVGGDGGFVHTVNAPVAFARTDTVRPGFMIKTVDAETIIVHSVDSVQDIASNASDNTFNLDQFAVRPTATTLFTYLANLLDLYTKYRLLSLKMHYVHFCPTTEPGSMMLTWCPDGNTTVPTTVAQMQNTNGCVDGAIYEDFAYEANPKQFSQDWKFISDVTDTDEDDRLIDEGIMFLATSNCTGGTSCGRFLVETEWALTGRRDPALAPMIGAIRQVMSSVGSDEAKSAAAGVIARAAVTQLLAKKRQIRLRPKLSDVMAQVVSDTAEFKLPDRLSETKDRQLTTASIPPAVSTRLNVRP